MKRRNLLFVILILLLSLACNIGRTAAPGESVLPASPTVVSVPTETQVPPTSTPAARGVFRLVVLVDTHSESVTRDQAQALVDESSGILYELTGFVLEMIHFQEIETQGSTRDMVDAYLASTTVPVPNGIILFSFGDNGDARRYGGYAYTHPGPQGFQNSFVAKGAIAQDLYIGVIHFGHRYAQCGYGDSDIPVSEVSIGGECRGQVEIACVEKNGYSMCSDAVGNLYASTLTYFSSSTFIHEIMHPFGELGVIDHFGTADCSAMMQSGVSDRLYLNILNNVSESQRYTGMCPYVFDNFIEAYQP